jgi:hypothetical protein
LALFQTIQAVSKAVTIHASEAYAAEEEYAYKSQPPPSDIWAAMRLTEPLLRVNGDLWQTIAIPAEVLFNKPIRVGCEDKGARKAWLEFFDEDTGTIPLNELALDCYFTTQQYGQWFPLEVWKGKELKGIAVLEPTSMWIGHHLGMGYPPMSITMPQEFTEAKLADMRHDPAFTTFVTDMNIQTFPAFRIPLPDGCLRPVYGLGKTKSQRYAIPYLSRAYKDIMYRMMLYEYREGILESWIAQIFMFIVKGWGNQPPPKGAVDRVLAEVNGVVREHKGELVFGWDVSAVSIKPERIAEAMATEAWIEASQTIFRHLGFDVFHMSGEIAGTHGRGGGVQVEVSTQVAMERWESLLNGYFKWARSMAIRWAEKNNPALAKHPPILTPGANAVKTQAAINAVVKPLVAAGLMSRTTGLERSGESFATELAHKQAEEPFAELFAPPPTFAQTAFGPGGEQTTTKQQTPGRPSGSKTEAEEEAEDEDIAIRAQRQHDDLKERIALAFAALLANPTPKKVGLFVSQVEADLRTQMGLAFSEGFSRQGGLGDPDLSLLNESPQGIPFHLSALAGFKQDILDAISTKDKERLGAMQHRAQQYAGALVTAYVLGTQAAARSIGSTYWQRVLHPELTKTGPCSPCIDDAAKIHPISEPFVAYHPAEACTMQAITYYFSNAAPLTVNIPPVVRPGQRVRRIPFGGMP